jgi:hypothetical protein
VTYFSQKKIFIPVVALALIFCAGVFRTAHAATATWTGGGGNANWSTGGNWSGGTGTGGAPGSNDVATFGSCSSNCSPTIDISISVAGINMGAAYSGTVTQASGSSITIGSSGFSQSAGTFVGSSNASDTITVSGNFTQTGGVLTSTAGNLAVGQDLNLTSGTFHNNSGTVTMTGSGGSWSTNLNCTGSPFNLVVLNNTGGGTNTATNIGSGCTVPLGTNPTSWQNNAWTNKGTIVIASGTWTINGTGNVNTADLTNNGTITNNGTGWVMNPEVGLIMGTGSFVTYNGTAITVGADLDVRQGSFPTSTLTVTMNGVGFNYLTNLNCTSSSFSNPNDVVILSNTASAAVNTATNIGSGCTVPLGTSPTSWQNKSWTNNGTIVVASGTWTLAHNYYTVADLTNNGTITNNGTGWVMSPFAGLIMGSSTSSVTYNGTAITMGEDLELASGTFPNNIAVTFNTATGYENDNTLTCGSTTLSSLTLAEGVNMTIAGNCTVTGNVLYSGAGTINNPGSAVTLTVQGNFTQTSASTFGGANLTLSLTGTSTSTINEAGGTFGANLNVSKTGIATAQLISNLVLASGSCTVNTGTLDMNSYNLTCGGKLTVNSGGWLGDSPTYTSTLTLGSSTVNNGVIFLDGSGPACTTPYPQYMNILSTASGTQRAWSGSGEFIIRSAYVQDQSASSSISVWNGGTMVRDSGWSSNSSVGRPQLVESTAANTGSGSTVTLPAFTYWPKPTDLIVVAVSGNETINAPTDNASNTYKLATTATYGSNVVSLYYAQNVNSTSSFVIKLNSGGGGSMSGAAYEFTGMAASGTFDSANQYTDISGTQVNLTSNGVAGKSTADELLVGASTVGTSGNTVTTGSGWTSLPGEPSGGSPGLSSEYISTSSNPGSFAATWTSNASTSYGALVGIFDPPGNQASGFAASGTLDSAIFDTKSVLGAQLNSVTWSGPTLPTGTSVAFQFAVSSSSAGPWNFVGPSGDGTTYFGKNVPPNTIIPLVSNIGGAGYAMFSGYRYFRYRVILFSDSSHLYTPTVTGVNVNWSP